jgi:hypothetical protein
MRKLVLKDLAAIPAHKLKVFQALWHGSGVWVGVKQMVRSFFEKHGSGIEALLCQLIHEVTKQTTPIYSSFLDIK